MIQFTPFLSGDEFEFLLFAVFQNMKALPSHFPCFLPHFWNCLAALIVCPRLKLDKDQVNLIVTQAAPIPQSYLWVGLKSPKLLDASFAITLIKIMSFVDPLLHAR